MKKGRNDLLLIVGVLLAAVIGLGCLMLLRRDGGYVTVSVGGQEVGRYPLDTPTVRVIDSGEGHKNTLVIEDGRAFMQSATCPDRLCCDYRPISHEGESIICLPHRLVVTVMGGHEDSGVDIIS